ncbi:actin family protein [Nosema bombycis CQ1]|uniref:Actin family protein n=1 Tax=Nosema bombycis (strain CQ1 / CVCC 102059) TaxID=578461 RepID=R0M9D6_NOSB1|nr:actin family protein [Nosema bombycis CQ1]|eukprot:EOB14594.1 actin family protein [Nosema bombycis CQ1]
MFFELNNEYKIIKNQYKKNSTIVIDNGTYEIKAGYIGSEPQIIFKNHFYKEPDGIKFNGQREKNRYSPFFNDMIAGFHCLEENLDQCFDYLKVKNCQNLIITDAIYSPTKKELLKFLFEVYRFQKIQIGVDAIYSYLYNKQDPNCIIISLSHSASYVYLMLNGKIADVYKLCYGGKLACKYLNNILKYKFKEQYRLF